MKILFIHQNFPGQFKHLAPALAADTSNTVVAMTMQQIKVSEWKGIKLFPYNVSRGSTPAIHPWCSDFESKVIRGEACFRAALRLKEQGFTPDLIIAHHGWGESLFVKDVWPAAKLGIYCEFYYHIEGADSNFDPEFQASDPGEVCRLHIKNINNLMHFEAADGAVAPTRWQASLFPEPFRQRIAVIHDGIDTALLVPNPHASITLNNQLVLTRNDEVITFVNRNLEPYRGYHVFMRSLPELLRRRPTARVVIVGGDSVSYGAKPPEGTTWKEIFIREVADQVAPEDWQRVHFVGTISYQTFVSLLQVSTVHVYLTYPFVLSWSLLEAMSIGCAIVASNTGPLHEAIVQDETGRLVDFFDSTGLVEEISALLDAPSKRTRLGEQARRYAKTTYDLHSVCLPKQLAWANKLGRGEL